MIGKSHNVDNNTTTNNNNHDNLYLKSLPSSTINIYSVELFIVTK